MFDKILSIMPYNPSLVHQMSFYGRRMREEASIRRLGIVFILLTFAVQFFAVLNPPQTTSAAACSDTAIIDCGAYTTADVKTAYDSDASIRTVYHYFGIDHNEINDLHTTAVTGYVTDGGRVLDQNGKEVATGTITAGWHDEAGSTRVDRQGSGGLVTFFTRPPSVSFNSPKLEAFVVMKDGVFQFAILKSCGNPVKAPTQPEVTESELEPETTPTPVFNTPTITLPPSSGPSANMRFACNRIDGKVGGLTSLPSIGDYYFRVYWDDGDPNPGIDEVKDILPNASDGTPAGGIIPSGSGRLNAFGDYAINLNGAAVFQGGGNQHFILRVYDNGIYSHVVYEQAFDASFNCLTPPPVTPPPPTVCPSNPAVMLGDAQCFDHCKYNPAIPTTDAACFPPCLYNNSIPADSNACKPCDKSSTGQDAIACVELHKTASNITAGLADANNTTAAAGDVITYTLYAENKGKATAKGFIFQENLSDVLDYATVTDLHGGTIDATKLVSWPAQDIAAGKTATVQVTVKVTSPIPDTPTGTSDPAHFDLIMTNVYGNAVNIKLPPSPAKAVQLAAAALPNTGPGTSLFIGAAIIIVSGYFYSRARLLARESNLAIREMASA